MPQKPLSERIKRAKREGVPFAVKESDAVAGGGRGGHSAKKSRGVVRFELPPGRRVKMKPQPGRGRASSNDAPTAASDGGKKRAQSEGASQGLEGARHVATVRGRKKPPSEMHIRHPGG